MSSHLELLYCSWRSTSGFHRIILLYWKRKGIRIEKHLQCEKLLGLAGGNTKKHGNKKSGESRTPIRYNVMIHYHAQLTFNCQLPGPSIYQHHMHGWTVYMTPNIQTLYLLAQNTVNEHYCPLNITLYHRCDRIDLGKPNSVETARSSLISQKCTYELRCNGLEFCSLRISCFHAFWCFPRPILAIFHIANVFLSGYMHSLVMLCNISTHMHPPTHPYTHTNTHTHTHQHTNTHTHTPTHTHTHGIGAPLMTGKIYNLSIECPS